MNRKTLSPQSRGISRIFQIMTHSTNPEAQARLEIDRQLEAAGWTVHSRAEINLFAGRG